MPGLNNNSLNFAYFSGSMILCIEVLACPLVLIGYYEASPSSVACVPTNRDKLTLAEHLEGPLI